IYRRTFVCGWTTSKIGWWVIVSRRGRLYAASGTSKTLALSSGKGVQTARREQGLSRRCSGDRCLQRKAGRGGSTRPLPRRFVLPAERHRLGVAAAARPQRRHPTSRSTFPREIFLGLSQSGPRLDNERLAEADALRLA